MNRTLTLVAALLVYSPVLLQGQSATARPAAIDTTRSTLTVHVFRAGVFSFAGDNHEVRAPIASGRIDVAKPAVEFVVRVSEMKVLDPNLDPGKRAQVQANMLGPEVLDPQRYPQITFRSTSVESVGADAWLVHGELNLHGVTQPLVVHVSRIHDEYRGTAKLKQTDFGIKPIRVAGGTVKVKDQVSIDFAFSTRK